ncbi:MAG: RsmD family RNA methyltransferase [Muribaculaceae bacterium]|nr:RsmD family RNA methyltransferase [Muribaculaceae bacterium]
MHDIKCRPYRDFASGNITPIHFSPKDIFNFIRKVKQLLKDDNLIQVKGDVFKFIGSCSRKFDLIFADPPYDLPHLSQIPELILNSQMVQPGTLVIVEHSKANDFSHLPQFTQQRVYGKVHFSFFQVTG